MFYIKKLALIFTLSLSFASFTFAAQNKLKVFQGNIITAYYNGEYKEIFRSDIIYGYGWLDDERIFIASQQEKTAEAVAELRILNLKTNTNTLITSLGCAGESHYDVNEKHKKIIFNDCEGIKLLTIKKNNSFTIKVLDKNENSWAVFWIDQNTIGFLRYNGSVWEFVKGKA